MRKTALTAVLLACGASTAFVSPALAESSVQIRSTLDGASVPFGGDPNGEGDFQAHINTTQGTICYQLQGSNIGTVTKAHIHEGASEELGRPVIDLDVGDSACKSVSTSTLQAIKDNPENYYVDILTTDYSKGAVRGQLYANNNN